MNNKNLLLFRSNNHIIILSIIISLLLSSLPSLTLAAQQSNDYLVSNIVPSSAFSSSNVALTIQWDDSIIALNNSGLVREKSLTFPDISGLSNSNSGVAFEFNLANFDGVSILKITKPVSFNIIIMTNKIHLILLLVMIMIMVYLLLFVEYLNC